jgi:putative DNA primase/helicase
MLDFCHALEMELESNGFDIHGRINYSSNKFQRFKSRSRINKGHDLFVVLIGNYEGASFGDWHDRSSWKTWFFKSHNRLNIFERSERKRLIAELKEKELKEKEKIRLEALTEAKKLISNCSQEIDWDHPYIQTKRIKPLYCGQIENKIIIPIYSFNGQLQSLQSIYPDGQKRFLKGASPKGGYLVLGETIESDDIIRVCEGWATGCSIYEAVGPPVVVSFNCDNLKEVIFIMTQKYGSQNIVICADNDQWSPNNIGLEAARFCADHYQVSVKFPDFSKFKFSNKPTDFNDLMCIAGIEEVEIQLL